MQESRVCASYPLCTIATDSYIATGRHMSPVAPPPIVIVQLALITSRLLLIHKYKCPIIKLITLSDSPLKF